MKYLFFIWLVILFGGGLIFQKKIEKPVVSIKEMTGVKAQKKCPTGFILVPGNPLYKTEDFCVMKYDAKCAKTANLNQGLEPDISSSCLGKSGSHSYRVYKNNGMGCECSGVRQVVSTASGFPITYIPMTAESDSAEKYCAAQGWHLINNNEWMTIARNAEQMDENWCDRNGTNCGAIPGAAGKILANGFNNGFGDGALTAGEDNQPCFGTTKNGSNVCGAPGSQKRTLTLNNGEVIWDLAGNVWQWVDTTVERKDQPRSETKGKPDNGWVIRSEFAPGGGVPSVLTDNGTGPNMGYEAFRPSNPTWNSNNGVGRIYHYSGQNDNDTTEYAMIRGGNWKHGSDDGAFYIHLSPLPNKTNINDVGFRCATAPE